MVIKTFAAVAATALAALATGPGVAMASGGSGPQPIQSSCPRAGVVVKPGGPVSALACCGVIVKGVIVKGGTVKGGTAKGGRPVRGVARPAPGKPQPVTARACRIQLMTFDMPAFSNTATEVSGPRLSAHELVMYKQREFLIASVHGRTFTLDRLPLVALRAFPVGGKPLPVGKGGKPVPIGKRHLSPVKPVPFTNGATAITDGRAFVLRGPVVIAVTIKPAPVSSATP
jgi:hypothetical protein